MLRVHLACSVLLTLAASSCSSKSTEKQPKDPEPTPVPTAQGGDGDGTAQPATPTKKTARLVETETLAANSIHIRVTDLPKPFATKSARKGPNVVSIPDKPVLRVPDGFTVNVFADDLDGPRWLALTPTGEVLVTETPKERIRLLADRDGDGVAEVKETFATSKNGLAIPFGMAFAKDWFFLGNTAEVRRYPYKRGQTSLEGKGEKITDLTPGGYRQHWTRNVVAAPDGDKLYITVGSRSNVDVEPLPRAAVLEMGLDGKNRSMYAHGLRNPVGLAVHPKTKDVYVTVNERDRLGDDLVPDYFTRVRKDEFFGWPFTYLTPTNLDPRRMKGGRSENPELAAKTLPPDVLFQAHSAALGVDFYTGTTFPEKYRGGAFVAFRGSWNRHAGTGYKLVYIPFGADSRPKGNYEDFLTGFLIDPSGPTTWGRPVGVLVLPDGSLIFTEEGNGRVYRVQYSG